MPRKIRESKAQIARQLPRPKRGRGLHRVKPGPTQRKRRLDWPRFRFYWGRLKATRR